jgi:hypothetical protein
MGWKRLRVDPAAYGPFADVEKLSHLDDREERDAIPFAEPVRWALPWRPVEGD